MLLKVVCLAHHLKVIGITTGSIVAAVVELGLLIQGANQFLVGAPVGVDLAVLVEIPDGPVAEALTSGPFPTSAIVLDNSVPELNAISHRPIIMKLSAWSWRSMDLLTTDSGY
jgi:hypothetical protein